MATHVFVDETKATGFMLAATILDSSDVGAARKRLRQLLLPGQRRLHFHNEQHARRQLIVGEIIKLPVAARIYVSSARAITGRMDALGALAADLAALNVERLVLEADEVALTHDVALLTNATRTLRRRSAFAFHHMPPSAEPLLWISDAVAWCYARGGRWRNTVEPVIDAVVRT